MTSKLEITWGSYLRFFVVLLGIVFLYLTRDVLVLLFLTLIIVSGLTPTVDKWSRYLSRPGAVIAVFLLIFAGVGLVSCLIVPPLVDQIKQLTENLPTYMDKLSRLNDNSKSFQMATNWVVDNLNTIASKLSDAGGIIFDKTVGVINGIVAVITVLILSFYLLLEAKGLEKISKNILPDSIQVSLIQIIQKITSKLGAWLGGQLQLMFAVGIVDTLGLTLIGSPYALTLGLWAGLTECIPIVGPWLGAIPAVLIGFSISPLKGFLTLIIYIVVQQLENSVLVPKIMGKAVGLNPVVVITAILIGGKLYGLFGIILSVPIAAVISVIVEDWQLIAKLFRGRKPAES